MSDAATTGASAPVRLSGGEAMPLLYALTARLAADNGVRLLAIKGVTLAHHGLRDPRVSADIDMLLHPDDLDTFVAAMNAAGWRIAAEPTTVKILGFHSVDLLNDHWPIGIDLHTFFPGFLAPPGEVFDVLWERREQLHQGGHVIEITDLASSTAIAALHYLRSIWRPENEQGMGLLVSKAQDRLSADERSDFVALAQATGSVRSLGPFREELGIEADPVHPAEQTGWDVWVRGTTAHPYMAWWYEFKRLRPWQWPAFLWRAVMLTPEEMRAYHAAGAHDSPMWKMRLERIKRVLRAVPRTAAHELRRRSKRTP